MSRAKFIWLRDIAALGLQWRKVTLCLYGPVECRLCVKVGRRKRVGNLMLGPSKLGKPRAREGPSVGKPSESSGNRWKRWETVGNVGKRSETSGSRRKRREAVGNVRKTSGSRRKRREAVRDVGRLFSKTAEC